MEIEIGLAPEVDTFDSTEIARFDELVEELGLTGQKELRTGNNLMPFRVMPLSERRIYKKAFRERHKLSDYGTDAIPVRVLEAVKLFKDNMPHPDYELYVLAEASMDDPVIVAERGYGEMNPAYLVARWGSSLMSLAELKGIALENTKRAWRKTIEERALSYEEWRRTMDERAEAYIAGDSQSEPW